MDRIARRVDLLLVILPFEEPLYERAHCRVVYVGNPVFDRLAKWEEDHAGQIQRSGQDGRAPVLALFPGSRRHEVQEALPAMLKTAVRLLEKKPDLILKVSCQRPRLRPGIDRAIRDAGIAEEVIQVHDEDPHALQAESYLSLVVSGTATLEQGYFGVPLVVVYPIRGWERWVFGQFSVTPNIALINLFAGQTIAPEVLFTTGEVHQIYDAAETLLDGSTRESTVSELARLKRERFRPGAPEKAAEAVVSQVREWTASV